MSPMNIRKILELLPHRYPFLMIDRVRECESGKRIVALKCVSINEPYFQGHFPSRPIMPGVLILEAMAQAAGILAFHTQGETPDRDSVYYYAGIDDARFKKPVVPGDRLEIEVTLERTLRAVWRFACIARVEGETVAQARILCSWSRDLA